MVDMVGGMRSVLVVSGLGMPWATLAVGEVAAEGNRPTVTSDLSSYHRMITETQTENFVPGSISVSTRACHARKRGSTPRQGVIFFCADLSDSATSPSSYAWHTCK